MSQSNDPYAIENLIWDCPNCGNKRIQGDVCPNCGTFKDNVKAGPQFRAPLNAPAKLPTTLATYSGELAPPLDPTALPLGVGDTSGPYRNVYQPQESPVTTDSFDGDAYARKQKNKQKNKAKNDWSNGGQWAPLAGEPFLFNRAHTGFAQGTTRQLARSWGGHFVTIMFVIGALIFLMETSSQYAFLTALRTRGATVTGTVTDAYFRRTTGKNATTNLYVVYLFRVNETPYTVSQSVGSDTYAALTKGTTVMVRYLPEDPTRARLGGVNADDGGIELAFYISLIVLILLGVWLVLWLDYMLRQRNLARDGQVIEGQLIRAKIGRNKSTYTLTAHYEFVSPQTGKRIKRYERTIRNDLGKHGAPSPGRPVQIVYLNDRTYRLL